MDYSLRHPDDFLERGNARFDKGDIDGAISDYTKAIELDPEFIGPVARNNRALAYEAKGMIDRAVSDYSAVIRSGDIPEIYKSYLNRGAILLHSKEFDKAIDDFTSLIITSKTALAGFEINVLTLSNAYSNRGIADVSIGNIENALADYNEAIRLTPGDSDIYVNRGNAFVKKGNMDHAVADYNKAATLNPKDFDIYFARGNARAKRGEISYAIADFEKYLSLGGGKFHNRQTIVENWILELKQRSQSAESGNEIFCLFYVKGSGQFMQPFPHAWIFNLIYYSPTNMQFRYDPDKVIDLGRLNNLLQADGNWKSFSDREDKRQFYIFLNNYNHINPEDVLRELQKYMQLIF